MWTNPSHTSCSSQFAALSYGCRKISLLYMLSHTHRTFCTMLSCVLPNLEITAKPNHALGVSQQEAAETAQCSTKAIMGEEFLYGWAAPNKTCSWSGVCFYSTLCWSFFVPGTPAEVNGLMHGPWMRDLFRLIHLSLKTLQDRIKAEVQDGAEGSPFSYMQLYYIQYTIQWNDYYSRSIGY